MRLRLRGEEIPYPLFTIKGRLRMSGLNDEAITEIMNEKLLSRVQSEEELLDKVRLLLNSYDSGISMNFETLTKYEKFRGESPDLPTIVVALEGASATGKSLIALELMHDLAATRFISTDSVRQVIRGLLSQNSHPELFCHTYQAYLHRQVGPHSLKPVIRGFLAQCEIITPHIVAMVERVVAEGAITLIEGVHLEPGTLQGLSSGVIEVLVNPDIDTHRSMFVSKHTIGKLKTVSEDTDVRRKEFEATRSIQDYLFKMAEIANIPVVPLIGYENARKEISKIILLKMAELLHSFEEGENK